MAIYTISATGGNFTDATTWDGGIVPLATDDIIGASGSGNLTINTATTIREVEFSNYLGVVNLQANWTLNGSSTFSATMSFTGSSLLRYQGNNSFFRTSNGCVIPNLAFTGNNVNYNFNDDHNVEVLNLSTQTNGGYSLVGPGNIRIKKAFLGAWGSTVNVNLSGNGSCKLIFDGEDVEYRNTRNVYLIGVPVEINTTGTFSVVGTASEPGAITMYFNSASNATGTFSYINGNINGDFNFILRSTTSGSFWRNVVFDLKGMTVSNLWYNDGSVFSVGTPDWFFESDFYCENFSITRWTSGQTTYTLSGAAAGGKMKFIPKDINFKINKMYGNYETYLSDSTPKGFYSIPTRLILTPGITYSIDNLYVNGMSDTLEMPSIISATAGTQAKLKVDNVSSLAYIQMQDIDASSGNEIKILSGSVSNCVNVATFSSISTTGGAGGEVSYTFLS